MDRDERRWFHITTHTYGSWLYGDPRGFRTRHHREHVEGDYKNPPPAGAYDSAFARSKRLLKQPPVIIPPVWRPVIGAALRDRFRELGAELIAISVSGSHVHVQGRLPDSSPRTWTGLAKLHAWHVARDRGWVGRLWAKRSRAEPIADRRHQVNIFHYIVRHRTAGAWVWSFRDPPDTTVQSPPAAAGGL